MPVEEVKEAEEEGGEEEDDDDEEVLVGWGSGIVTAFRPHMVPVRSNTIHTHAHTQIDTYTYIDIHTYSNDPRKQTKYHITSVPPYTFFNTP